MKNQRMRKVKIEKATTPRTGNFRVFVGWWWVVTPEEEILLYRGVSPQCNESMDLAVRVRDSLYPDCTVRRLPVVYIHEET